MLPKVMIALLQPGIMHHVVFSCTSAMQLAALLANSQNSAVHSNKEFSTGQAWFQFQIRAAECSTPFMACSVFERRSISA